MDQDKRLTILTLNLNDIDNTCDALRSHPKNFIEMIDYIKVKVSESLFELHEIEKE